MIVYVATIGRSGSTFFRIVLNKIFGFSSYAGPASSEDLTTIGAEDLSGYKPFSELVPHWDSRDDLYRDLKELDDAEEIYFIKTHSPNPLSTSTDLLSVHDVSKEDQDNFRSIVIVRDGRDTYISFAKYFINLKFTWKTWFSFSGNYPHRIVGSQRGASVLKQELHSLFLVIISSLFKLLGLKNKLFQNNLKALVNSKRWDLYHPEDFGTQSTDSNRSF